MIWWKQKFERTDLINGWMGDVVNGTLTVDLLTINIWIYGADFLCIKIIDSNVKHFGYKRAPTYGKQFVLHLSGVPWGEAPPGPKFI